MAFLAAALFGCDDPASSAACEISKLASPKTVLLDAHDYSLDPELSTLEGTVLVIDRYDDGHPRQVGIAIEPSADTFWRVDGSELVWFSDGVLARQLEAYAGREVRVDGVLREGHSRLRAIDLRSYEIDGVSTMLPEPQTVSVEDYVEGTVTVVERNDDGHPRVLGIERGCETIPLEDTNKSRELLYRIGRTMRVDGVSLDDNAFTVVSYAELEGSPRVEAGEGFRLSFLAGGLDENGRFMGGVEIDALAAFDGRIFAGSSYRKNTQEGSPDPEPPGAQVLVLDAPDGRWRVDFEVPREEAGNAPRMIFLDLVRFETDHNGRALDPPVEMLASVSGNGEVYLREKGEPGRWFATGIRELVQSVAGPEQRPDARSVASYRDRITGISHLFVGTGVGRSGPGGGIYRGAYDPSLPGLIAWSPEREIEIPDDRPNPRVMGFTTTDGGLYASVGAQLLRREDGETASWTEILFVPNALSFRGDSLRRATEMHEPDGSSALLLGIEGAIGQVMRVEIEDDDSSFEELTVQSLFSDATYTIVAYDGPVIRTGDDGTEAAILGFEMNRVRWTAEPDPGDFDLGRVYEFSDGLFLWREPNGDYWLNRIIDPTLEVPPPLVAPRTILAHSPFPGEEDVVYFGGFDHNGHLFHNTAWIAKAHLDDLREGRLVLDPRELP